MYFILSVLGADTSNAQNSEYRATHYGTSFQGGGMKCGGRYNTDDSTILAVGPHLFNVPCGTPFTIIGPNGSIEVTKTDHCGGCDANGYPFMLDLSEAGHIAVCGIGTCRVTLLIKE